MSFDSPNPLKSAESAYTVAFPFSRNSPKSLKNQSNSLALATFFVLTADRAGPDRVVFLVF
jgi:hypothetical protein